MISKEKSNNGITLIVLVITIIILLILTGITISVINGDNGLFYQAKTAKEETYQGIMIGGLTLAAFMIGLATTKEPIGTLTLDQSK